MGRVVYPFVGSGASDSRHRGRMLVRDGAGRDNAASRNIAWGWNGGMKGAARRSGSERSCKLRMSETTWQVGAETIGLGARVRGRQARAKRGATTNTAARGGLKSLNYSSSSCAAGITGSLGATGATFLAVGFFSAFFAAARRAGLRVAGFLAAARLAGRALRALAFAALGLRAVARFAAARLAGLRAGFFAFLAAGFFAAFLAAGLRAVARFATLPALGAATFFAVFVFGFAVFFAAAI